MLEPHGRDIVVIGASAGGIEALTRLTSQLPADLPAAVFVVLHVSAGSTSVLPAILNRHTRLPAAHPRPAEPLERGRIYVAPPDHHLMVEPGRVLLTRGPRENRVRPAIDVLFRSAAVAYGARVIGVVLTGYLDDGAAGLVAIRRAGGTALVQDPEDAQCAGMPRAALHAAGADHVFKLDQVGPVLERLVRSPIQDAGALLPDNLRRETESAKGLEPGVSGMGVQHGAPTALACPECGGGLFEGNEGRLDRYRCYLGHVFGMESLLEAQEEQVERSLWVALRLLEERAGILEKMVKDVSARGGVHTADQFAARAAELRRHAERLRELIR